MHDSHSLMVTQVVCRSLGTGDIAGTDGQGAGPAPDFKGGQLRCGLLPLLLLLHLQLTKAPGMPIETAALYTYTFLTVSKRALHQAPLMPLVY